MDSSLQRPPTTPPGVRTAARRGQYDLHKVIEYMYLSYVEMLMVFRFSFSLDMPALQFNLCSDFSLRIVYIKLVS